MSFANLSGISVAFGDRDILDNVNLNISAESRIALAGANGSGKSTLLKIASGIAKPDSGTVSCGRGARISYLPQSGIVFRGNTLEEEAEASFAAFDEMVRKMRQIEKELSGRRDEDSEVKKLLEEHHLLQEALLDGNYYEREKQIDIVLTGLGFSRDDFRKKSEEFSGGWQMRIALARILLEKPDIMLLDEPTNYLDIEARQWLEDFIARFRGGVVIVSHDRFFLDVTCREVVELFNGKLTRYRGNYSSYEKTRKQELEALVESYERQQEEISRIEYFIRKFRYNASKAPMVQSRIKQLENLERIEIPESLKKIHFSFPPPPHSGREVFQIESLNKYYGTFQALKEINLTIMRGEKIALAGKNGAGKSTLLRILSQVDNDFSGAVRLGKDVVPGYFSQDFEATLDNGNTIIEEVESVSPLELIPGLRNLLGAFLFRGDDVHKKISVLSGGEKNRIALLKLLLHPSNLLVLDEPTNHLDLNSKDILLEALKKYQGTLIFVSHDRYFIEKLATRVIALESGKAKDYPGDYEYYLWIKEREEAADLQAAERGGAGAGAVFTAPGPSVQAGRASVSGARAAGSGNSDGSASSREEGKAAKREKRRLERRSSEIMAELEKLEKEALTMEREMSMPENYSDGDKIKALKCSLEKNRTRQLELTDEWEQIEADLESVNS